MCWQVALSSLELRSDATLVSMRSDAILSQCHCAFAAGPEIRRHNIQVAFSSFGIRA